MNFFVGILDCLESLFVILLEGMDGLAHFLFGRSVLFETVQLDLHFLGQGILLGLYVVSLSFTSVDNSGF